SAGTPAGRSSPPRHPSGTTAGRRATPRRTGPASPGPAPARPWSRRSAASRAVLVTSQGPLCPAAPGRTMTLLPAGDGGVHLPEEDLGGLGGGDLLPAGGGEPHRVAFGQRARALERHRSARHAQGPERGLRELDHLAGPPAGGEEPR